MTLSTVNSTSPWLVADSTVAFLFALFTTAIVTFLIWKVMNSFLDLFLGRGMAFLGAIFSAVLVLASGLKVAVSFLEAPQRIPILHGLISGIVTTVNACIAPRFLNPIEFLVLISFGLYICFWLHTRFMPKHTMDDLKRKIDRAIDEEGKDKKKSPYPY